MARKPAAPPGRAVSDDESMLWENVMREAQPLTDGVRKRKADTVAKTPNTVPKSEPAPAAAAKKSKPAAPSKALDPPQAAPTPPPGVEVQRATAPKVSIAGLDKRNAQRLRRGQMDIEARLDLHGHTREAAHRALSDFITANAATGKRCVLVITGKGTPRAHDDDGFMPERTLGILRKEVPRWLSGELKSHIVAWTPAVAKDGGGGALYVLLKRRRKPKPAS